MTLTPKSFYKSVSSSNECSKMKRCSDRKMWNSFRKSAAPRKQVFVSLSCIYIVVLFFFKDSYNRIPIKRILCESTLSGKINEGSDTDGIKNAPSFFTNLIDRVLQTTTSDVDPTADCETQFPDQVAFDLGSAYYASPGATESGIYYAPESPIPIPDEMSIVGGFIDPSLLAPKDSSDSTYYSPVNTAILNTYTTQIYDPVDTTIRPEGTTAYAVTITSCPEFYEPAEPDVTDPGAELYEASAMIKESVCSVVEVTAIARRKALRNLRGLQTTDTTGQETYTM